MKTFNKFSTALLSLSLAASGAAHAESPEVTAPSQVETALMFLQDGSPLQAEQALLDVSVRDTEFDWAFFELQKLRYRRGDWKSFFGGMVYYRYHMQKKIELPELLLLESMALIQHCQFVPAEKVLAYVMLDSTVSGSHQLSNVKEAKKVLQDLLDFQKITPGNVMTQATAPQAKVFSAAQEWRVSAQTAAQVSKLMDYPHVLRVYVENKCDPTAKKGGER